MNAKITFTWPSGTILTHPAEWCGFNISIDDDIVDDIFFSDKFAHEWTGGRPDIDIILNENPKIRSRVAFEDNTGELYSTRKLDNLIKNES